MHFPRVPRPGSKNRSASFAAVLAAAAIASGGAAFAVALEFGIGIGLSAALICAGLGYFAMRRTVEESLVGHGESRLGPALLVLVPLACGTLVWMSFRTNGRPPEAFALAFLMALATAYVVSTNARTNTSSALAIVIVLAAGVLMSRLTVYETVGGDAFFHRSFVERIATTGTTDWPETIYGTFPLLHLGAAQLVTVFGIGPDTALTAYTLVPYLASIGLVFAIGARLHSRAVGLWAAVLLAISRWYLYWGATETPMQAAFALFVLGIFLLIEYQQRPGPLRGILLILVVMACAFLHPFGTVAIALACLVAATTYRAVRNSSLPSGAVRAAWPLAVLSCVVPLTVWIYNGFAFDRILTAIADAISHFEGALSVTTRRDTFAYEMDHLGDNVLFAGAGIACLLLIRRWGSSAVSPFWIQIAALFIIAALLGVGGDILGLVGLLGFRWLLFATPMAALLVAWVLVHVGSLSTVRLTRPVTVIAIASYAMLGVTNGSVAQDAPWYGHHTTPMQDLTADDISMTRYVAQLSGVHATTDRELFQALTAGDLASGTTVSVLNEESWPPGSDPPFAGVALREADFERSLALDEPIEQTWWTTAPNMYARIYDNGAAGVWLRVAGAPQ